jgi:hypothetical protein
VALLAFAGATALLDRRAWTLPGATLLLLAAILVAARLLPPRACTSAASVPPWWDLPARMAVATGFVLALTAGARYLGPQLSGLIAPFPVFGVVLAAFTQRRHGPAAATALVRGNVVGSLAFIAFFGVAGLVLGRLPLAAAYLLAALAAVAASGALFLAGAGAGPRRG